MNKDDIKLKLDEQGTDYPADATKDALLALLNDAPAEPEGPESFEEAASLDEATHREAIALKMKAGLSKEQAVAVLKAQQELDDQG